MFVYNNFVQPFLFISTNQPFCLCLHQSIRTTNHFCTCLQQPFPPTIFLFHITTNLVNLFLTATSPNNNLNSQLISFNHVFLPVPPAALFLVRLFVFLLQSLRGSSVEDLYRPSLVLANSATC